MTKSVIFDMDGVLIDSEPLHYESDRRTMREYGLELSDAEMEAYVGITGEKMWADLREKYGIADSVETLMRKQEAHKRALFGQDVQPIDGIPELLEALQSAGRGIALASSSPRYFIDMVLEGLGLRRYFPVVVSGADVKKGKPAPDIFLRAAELLGVEPQHCVVIEDSGHGVRAAKAAGMHCIGLVTPNSGKQDLSLADIVVESVFRAFPYIGLEQTR